MKINESGEEYLTDIFRIGYKKGIYCGVYFGEKKYFMGINTVKELCAAEELYQDRLRNNMLDHGCIIKDIKSVFFSYDTIIGKGVEIYPFVVIGKKVRIGDNSKILSFCNIEESDIGEDVELGPYARLRGKNYINNQSVIGNFVEVKNSVIGYASKVKHLCYLGDVELGKKVNVGAGVVFCNYDGNRKYKSFVGDGVFIGGNVTVISPVDIGRMSRVGAGTVVDINMGDFSLGIGRVRMTEKKDYYG